MIFGPFKKCYVQTIRLKIICQQDSVLNINKIDIPSNLYIYIYTAWLAQWVECSPMVRQTWVQSQVVSYQRL